MRKKLEKETSIILFLLFILAYRAVTFIVSVIVWIYQGFWITSGGKITNDQIIQLKI